MVLNSTESITTDKPTEINFQTAARGVDEYFKTFDNHNAHVGARGFAEGLYFGGALSKSEYHRLVDYIETKYKERN
jgi:hypothetical protein